MLTAPPIEPADPAGEGSQVVIREAHSSQAPAASGAGAAAAGAGGRITLQPSFRQEHNLRNLLAAVAAARALGVTPHGQVDVRFSALRGERLALDGGVVLINDCYNANPMSMRAAIDDLAETSPARRVAVLGDMLELGPEAPRFHREIGEHASARGIDVLVTVGVIGAETRGGFAGEAYSVSDARAAAELLERTAARRGYRARQGLAGSRSRAGCRDPVRRLRAVRGAGRSGCSPRVLGRSRASLMGRILIGGTASLLICIFLSPKFIEFLRKREFGQQIREDGPEGHHQKAGTPTMGGIIIFVAVSVAFLILTNYEWRSVGVFGAAIACALLGFADDYTKLVKRRSLGLRARTKLAVTIAISLGLWYIAEHQAHLAPTLRLRFVDYQIDLGWFYPVLIYFVVAGTTSAVNLTDGLDGLAAGCAAIVLLAYIGITFITGEDDLAMLAGCLVGGCIGFLWFNAFPATIFMGDTGSLGLGGAIAGLAVMTKTELLLILLGGIFVIEALSVVIQVISFQTTRKRVFLMAPIHHHFELRAWSETKIILRFWIVAAVCCAIGFTIYRQSIG